MPLSPDSVGEGIMFSGCPSDAFVRSFVRTDLVTTVSHELLEQSRWNLHGIFSSPLRRTCLDFGGQSSRLQEPSRSNLANTISHDYLSNLDETFGEWPLATIDDPVWFCRSKVKVTADRRGSEGIHIDAGVLKCILFSNCFEDNELRLVPQFEVFLIIIWRIITHLFLSLLMHRRRHHTSISYLSLVYVCSSISCMLRHIQEALRCKNVYLKKWLITALLQHCVRMRLG